MVVAWAYERAMLSRLGSVNGVHLPEALASDEDSVDIGLLLAGG